MSDAPEQDRRTKFLPARGGARNGAAAASAAADAASGGPEQRSRKVAELFQPLPVRAEQMNGFASLPGVDEEPWDVLLSTLGVEEHSALQALAKRCGLPFDPEPKPGESAERFYERIPAGAARRHQIAGLSSDGEVMRIATAQPLQPAVFSAVERALEMPISLVLSPRAQVGNLINRGYEQRTDLVTEIVEDMPFDERAIESAAGSVSKATDLLQLARQTPVIRLVNMILFEALRLRASDIHIHPLEGKLVIRFRVDGMLVDAFSPPLSLAPAISSRIKVMSELDIANRHSPQDGQTTVRIGSRKIDIRISCVPTIFGERIVLRLLDQSQTQLSLDALGMTRPMQGRLVDLISRPTGMILVTGPTGSGKTTTLYAALEKVDRTSRNVLTIEDPVEYHMDNIGQVQVNPKRGVTFASGLRSLLRQDPDVILVGEIRDAETAHLAIQAALTGHLVLATLHTNDSPSAISRLQDIGIEPYLISSALLAVLGQRLLRRTCSARKGLCEVAGSRCEKCLGTGYSGRVAIYEMMPMSDEIRRMAMAMADSLSVMAQAQKEGMRPMVEDGRDKVALGLTTETELHRVLHQALMPTESSTQFFYTAVSGDGSRKRGMRVARDQSALGEALSDDGLLLLSARRMPAWTVSASRLPLNDQALFNQQLGMLLSRGVPLVEALDVASSVVTAAGKEKVERIRTLVRAGASFSDACEQAGAFDDITVMVYRSAERTGDLADAAQRLAKAAQRRRAIATKAGTLMVYPSIVLFVSVFISIIVLTVVVPRIGAALAEAGKELPWYTQAVVSLGNALRSNGLIILLVVAGLVCAGVVARRYVLAALAQGLRLFPPVAKLALAMESARFFATMAAMTRSGVTIADALGVAAGAVSYPPLRAQLEDMRRRLVEGGLLRTLLERAESFPLATRRLLIAAERSGDLDAAFDSLAEDMALEVDRRSERLLAMLEPAMIIIMFVLIGSLLMSIMIPMISITSGFDASQA